MTQLQILTEAGNVLAVSELPANLFIEGEHGDVKTFDFSMKVIASGEAKKFRVTDAVTTSEGEVKQGEADALVDGVFSLTKVDLRVGDRIMGRARAITMKEEVTAC